MSLAFVAIDLLAVDRSAAHLIADITVLLEARRTYDLTNATLMDRERIAIVMAQAERLITELGSLREEVSKLWKR